MDKKTKYTAGIMLLSLAPFVILQLANIFNTLYGSRVVILIAFIVSALSLLSYFIYQVNGGLHNYIAFLKFMFYILKKKKKKKGLCVSIIVITALHVKCFYDEKLAAQLIMSLSCFFQVLDPWIQERSLEYFKYQNLLTEFLNHAEKCGKAKLINENGEPNISLIKRYKFYMFSAFSFICNYMHIVERNRGPSCYI